MSKFYTAIPVALAATIAALPKGSYLHGVKLNEEEGRVEVHWEHDDYATGLDHAVEFKAEEFEQAEAEPEPKEPAADPAGTSAAQAAANGAPAAVEPAKTPKAAKAVRTLKAKAAARPKA